MELFQFTEMHLIFTWLERNCCILLMILIHANLNDVLLA